MQVPFLSLGSDGGDVGQRSERCRGKSLMSGEFVVEDVSVNGEIYRRLVFFNNPKLIQSECRITLGRKQKVQSKQTAKRLEASVIFK